MTEQNKFHCLKMKESERHLSAATRRHTMLPAARSIFFYKKCSLDISQTGNTFIRRKEKGLIAELLAISPSVSVLDGILYFNFIWRISLLVGMKFYSAEQIWSGEHQTANKMSRGHFEFPLFPFLPAATPDGS